MPRERVMNHLLGTWDNNNVSLDLTKLQDKIKEISESHISTTSASGVATSFLATLQHYTSTTAWFPSLINLGISVLISVYLLFFFPVIVKLLSRAIRQTHLELKTL